MSRLDRIVISLLLAGFLAALGYGAAWGGVSLTIAGIFGPAFFIALYFVWAGPLLSGVFLRVLAALIPLVGLAALVILWIVKGLSDAVGVKTALITGTVIAAGWIATWLAAEYRRDRDRDQTRREVLYALRSEIFTAFQTLDSIDWRQNAEEIQDKIRDGGDCERTRYHPFVGTESPPIVFQAVSGAINLLPEGTLEPVLRFYSALNDLATLGADMRSDTFAGLDAKRRIGGHVRLTDTRIATLKWAMQSIIAIDAALGVENPERIERSGKNAHLRIVMRDGEPRVEAGS